jgi:glycosyltransferase involved in cell wall biosynthesis
MATVLFTICLISLLWWLELALEWATAASTAEDLARISVDEVPVSRLSVVIPARNEESTIEKALTSVLTALPERGEAILVNDRSTDGTGLIATSLADSDKRLTVLTIKRLPDGWLGKNHAMWEGYRISRGDYLLFTDADVVFEPGCLEKALVLCEKEDLDHLIATPSIITDGFWERTFVSFFSILLMARYRIWRAASPRSRFYAGIGAFNMVRRKLYEEAGTHGALKGEAVDDLRLGRLLKRSGGRSKVVSGIGCLRVRWNIGLRGLMEGLEKNSYAVFDYNLFKAAAGILVLLSGTLIPALAPFFLGFPGENLPLRLAAFSGLGAWCVFAALYRLASYPTGATWLYFITFPLGAFLLMWTILRSVVLYHARGGIKWRGTVYRKMEGEGKKGKGKRGRSIS